MGAQVTSGRPAVQWRVRTSELLQVVLDLPTILPMVKLQQHAVSAQNSASLRAATHRMHAPPPQ